MFGTVLVVSVRRSWMMGCLVGLCLTALSGYSQISIIPPGSIWRYLDDGSNQGSTWTSPSFEDASWAEGPAQLGFGEGDEQTVINGGDALSRTTTIYFRKPFAVQDPHLLQTLLLRLLRDDGAVVYLNGQEVYRSNMPEGAIDFTTFATAAVDGEEEDEFLHWPLNPSLLVAGRNVLAVEVHQVNMTSSDLGFDLELAANLPASGPEVILLSPAEAQIYIAPAMVALSAQATDLDGYVAKVEFFADGKSLGAISKKPYEMMTSELSPGRHFFTAMAVDNSGRTGRSSPVSVLVVAPPVITSLIATNSTWRYLDDGSDQGTAWRERLFDDSSWNSGPARFGFSDSALTELDFGISGDRTITHYFRRAFEVADPSGITNLAFGVVRDDGVVAYLNGREIFRMNMPEAGPIDFQTLASSPVGGTNEFYFYPANIEPVGLEAGINVLAVELHQNSPATTDAGFDLFLDAMAPPIVPPNLFVERGSDGTWRLVWFEEGYVLQTSIDLSGGWSDLSPAVTVSPYELEKMSGRHFYRLRQGP